MVDTANFDPFDWWKGKIKEAAAMTYNKGCQPERGISSGIIREPPSNEAIELEILSGWREWPWDPEWDWGIVVKEEAGTTT